MLHSLNEVGQVVLYGWRPEPWRLRVLPDTFVQLLQSGAADRVNLVRVGPLLPRFGAVLPVTPPSILPALRASGPLGGPRDQEGSAKPFSKALKQFLQQPCFICLRATAPCSEHSASHPHIPM